MDKIGENLAWIIKMKKILLTRIRKERSNIANNEHQQGRLTSSLLDETKKNIIRWYQQQTFQKKLTTEKHPQAERKKTKDEK